MQLFTRPHIGRLLLTLWVAAFGAVVATPAAFAKPVSVIAAESSYGSMVKMVGGDHVDVSSLLDSPDVDPHKFKSSPKIGRQLSQADLVVMNGQGFDGWLDPLLEGSKASDRRVVKASEAGSAMVMRDDNAHLFYSPQAMLATASHVATALAEIDPDHKSAYQDGLAQFREQLLPVYEHIQKLIASHPNLTVTATVPVYNYMLNLLGYNVLYHDIQFASMHGSRPSAKQVKKFISGLKNHKVSLLIYNVQVHSRLTKNQIQTAKDNGVPVVGVSAIPLHGENYAEWQIEQLKAIEKALEKADNAA
ncbi:zinc ABC transporter solute-binding protein [Salinisphaera sp. USBA-960]|nr:zinc ABC transporter solute-binding protein [Salifodinibacter halophilus]NNC27036.1 zinc ABC transporter solute-binding protein [Salifodinibacter halophilus]